ARDIVLLKQVGINPIVVHGGGPQIAQMLEKLGIKSNFVDGLRVTDEKTVEIVEMVLAGSLNKQIAAAINRAGGVALGLCGKDGHLIRVKKLTRTKRDPDSNIEKVVDLGFVGEPEVINANLLETLDRSGIIPVIAPVGFGNDGRTYNINADTAAGTIAGAMRATRLLMMTDVVGVLDRQKKLMQHLTPQRVHELIADGTISGGMIPKVETCLDAVAMGVEGAVILDGRLPHAILLELFSDGGVGTLIGRAAT
ncbi:MAG: acetylglutamate kinase, partial [Alphaproteobacteria bacterium]|nr:acetylglutamate kinase [Alphaproteobacteria bacterium]